MRSAMGESWPSLCETLGLIPQHYKRGDTDLTEVLSG